MKKMYKFAATVALSVLFAACNDGSDSSFSDLSTGGMTLSARHETISRTEFDGTKTVWSDGDAVSVFVDGNGDVPYKFEVTDPAEGTFRNDVIALDKEFVHTFHAVYPDVKSTELANGIILEIGAASQTQNGSSAEHIAALDPLVGQTMAYPSDVTVTMEHTAAVLKLTIDNEADALSVGSVKIEAPEGVFLYGKHTLDLETCKTEAIAGRSGNVAAVTVSGSDGFDADGNFTVWAAVAPFEIPAGEKLTFTVTDEKGGTYAIDKVFAEGKSFSAGMIMATTLELSDRTMMAEEINVNVDFTDPDAYSQEFPTTTADKIMSGSYMFSGYTFAFSSDVPYCRQNTSSGWALCFDQMTKNNTVKIGIPRIEGYAPTAVTVGMHLTAVSAQNAKVAVVTDNAEITGWKYNNQAKIVYELDDTDDVAEYYLCIEGYANSKYNCRLSSLSITYGRLP